MVCFPHAGGSASYYHPVSASLSPAVDVLSVQYPGRQDRRSEPLIDDLAVLADGLTDVLAEWTDRPLAFFGHSMGATLAFEVGRRLERRGVTLAGLFASGRRAPAAHRDERVHLKDDDGLPAEMKSLSGTDSRLLDDDEIIRMVLPSVRNDYKATECYRYLPGSDVNCPIVALHGDADPKVTVAEADEWRKHTTGSFDRHVFPGGHFYLNNQQAAVLRLLSSHLSVVTAASSN